MVFRKKIKCKLFCGGLGGIKWFVFNVYYVCFYFVSGFNEYGILNKVEFLIFFLMIIR